MGYQSLITFPNGNDPNNGGGGGDDNAPPADHNVMVHVVPENNKSKGTSNNVNY